MEDHRGQPWYYLVVIAVGLVPWSVFLGAAVWYGSWPVLRRSRQVGNLPPRKGRSVANAVPGSARNRA